MPVSDEGEERLMNVVAEGKRHVGVAPLRGHLALRRRMHRALIYLILSVGAVVLLFPLYWLVSTSLKATNEINVFPPTWIPSRLVWENYVTLFQTVPFWTYMQNSLIITLTSVVGTVFSSALVGFSFARLRFPG